MVKVMEKNLERGSGRKRGENCGRRMGSSRKVEALAQLGAGQFMHSHRRKG